MRPYFFLGYEFHLLNERHRQRGTAYPTINSTKDSGKDMLTIFQRRSPNETGRQLHHLREKLVAEGVVD